MTLYLPPRAAALERQRFEADVLERCETDATTTTFTRALRRVDPKLTLVRAREQIDPGTPLVAGYFHILRDNGPDVPMSIFTLHANGRFIEPNSRIFDRLAAGNLHDPRVFAMLEDAPRRAKVEAERQKALEREQRHDELKDRVNAATRATVSMDTSLPWTQSSNGRRGARP